MIVEKLNDLKLNTQAEVKTSELLFSALKYEDTGQVESTITSFQR